MWNQRNKALGCYRLLGETHHTTWPLIILGQRHILKVLCIVLAILEAVLLAERQLEQMLQCV